MGSLLVCAGPPVGALTKAALFVPTSIPCQHPSALWLQISCPLAAFQEAARVRDVDGKGISGAGWWKVVRGCGVQAGAAWGGGAAPVALLVLPRVLCPEPKHPKAAPGEVKWLA